VLGYTGKNFGIFNWSLEEIRRIERKIRKVLTIYKMHHANADIVGYN